MLEDGLSWKGADGDKHSRPSDESFGWGPEVHAAKEHILLKYCMEEIDKAINWEGEEGMVGWC